MWAALGNCYEKMDSRTEAQKCYEWSERVKDREAIALHKLGKLYVQTGDNEKAAICFVENIKRRDQEDVVCPETLEALQWLSEYYMRMKDHQKAYEYCLKLIDFSPAGLSRDKAL